MSDHTKYALARSLNKVLQKKPLDKITISDLTEDCGVNRQTFYYHFHDIYDLIEWIYVTWANKAIGTNRNYANWQEGMIDMCDLMLDNRSFLLKTYHSRSGGHLHRILLERSYDLLIGVINELSRGVSISEENKAFIAGFYKYGFAGLVIEWINDGMKEDPKQMVGRLEKLIQGNFPEAIRRFAAHN